MLPHHVNSLTIPVDLGIVFRENAKIPEPLLNYRRPTKFCKPPWIHVSLSYLGIQFQMLGLELAST